MAKAHVSVKRRQRRWTKYFSQNSMANSTSIGTPLSVMLRVLWRLRGVKVSPRVNWKRQRLSRGFL